MKFWKTFLISFFCLAVILAGVFTWQQKKQDFAAAQDFWSEQTEIVCEEPIPIGIAIDTTIDFLDKVYQVYQADNIKTAKDRVNDLVALINANGNGKVCDFNNCKANIINIGPELKIRAQALPGVPAKKDFKPLGGKEGEGVPPICVAQGEPNSDPKGCLGNPCPSLNQFLQKSSTNPLTLEGLKNVLNAEAKNIHDLFEAKTQTVPFGLEKPGEIAGETKISDADLVYRYIDSIENDWLTPNPLRNTCALSELDKARISQGKMGQKFPKSCLSALSEGIYGPKAWSETCQKECEQFGKDCTDCLAKCEGESVYAALNCKIYSKNDNKKCAPNNECCGDKCSDGLTSECYSCLCDGLSVEQCLNWVCGGSKSNWVCCHEEPIENPMYYYVSAAHHPGEDIEFSQEDSAQVNKDLVPGIGESFSLTAYAEPCFPENKCSSKGTMINFGQIAIDPTIIPYGAKVAFTSLIEAKDKKPKTGAIWQNSYKIGSTGEEILNNSSTNSSQYFCACDTGDDIKGYRIDVWLPSLNDAKSFGRRIGTVEVIEYNSQDCCKNKHKCCQAASLKADDDCKTYSANNPTGFICEPNNLNACKDANKPEYKNVKNNLCKKYYNYQY